MRIDAGDKNRALADLASPAGNATRARDRRWNAKQHPKGWAARVSLGCRRIRPATPCRSQPQPLLLYSRSRGVLGYAFPLSHSHPAARLTLPKRGKRCAHLDKLNYKLDGSLVATRGNLVGVWICMIYTRSPLLFDIIQPPSLPPLPPPSPHAQVELSMTDNFRIPRVTIPFDYWSNAIFGLNLPIPWI